MSGHGTRAGSAAVVSATDHDQPYVIAMPVPNITGELHIGHALNLVIQDVFARHLRQRGRTVVFRPGVDHAGLSGQLAAERALEAEGRTRKQLGRDGFRSYMTAWHDRHQQALLRQMRRLGISADWDHPVSSIDAHRSALSRAAFVDLWRRGIIYHEVALVNWCTRCETCIPDEEISRVELTRTAYLLSVTDDRGQHHTLATLRPHLLCGASAVLAPPGHPATAAASVHLPGLDLTLPMVAGRQRRDRTLGAHLSAVLPMFNADDFDTARAEGSVVRNVFAADGTISLPGTPYDGCDPEDCDSQLIARFEQVGALAGTEPYLHGDAYHTSCRGAVVPRVVPQWFIRVAALEPTAEWLLAHPVTRLNHPLWESRYRQVISDVLDGDRQAQPWWEGACLAFIRGFASNQDWLISRQNWWGIPVPAWHCARCDQTTVSDRGQPTCGGCGQAMSASEDVLDVLFHSALWAACVTTDTGRAYHADLAVIGHDILEFWIPTANLLSRPLFDSVSIRDVFVHGVICDRDGRKMSKSAGNAVSLEDLLTRHGTEVTRGIVLGLAGAAAASESVALTDEHIARSADRISRLAAWCAEVSVGQPAPAAFDRRLADVGARLDTALDAMAVGPAYEAVIELVDALPATISPGQQQLLTSIIEPFHPHLAELLRGRRPQR